MSHEQEPQEQLELMQTSFGDVQEYARKHKEALEAFKEELLLLQEMKTPVNIKGYAGWFTNKVESEDGSSRLVRVPVGSIKGPRKPREMDGVFVVGASSGGLEGPSISVSPVQGEGYWTFSVRNILKFEIAKPEEVSSRIKTQRAILGAAATGMLPLRIKDEA